MTKIILTIILINLGFTSFSQGKNPNIEFHTSFLWKPNYLSEFVGISYTLKERLEISTGLTFGMPFSGGMGIASEINLKALKTDKTTLSLNVMYRINSGVIRRKENSDSIYSEYLIPNSQFLSAGISFDYEFKDLNRIRISPVYYFPFDNYQANLVIGNPNESIESNTQIRMKQSFGLHITFIFTDLWKGQINEQ